MKIILTGAQGTGKTTILKYFSNEYSTITEVVRNLSKQNIKVNEEGDEEGQKTIFNLYNTLLSKKCDYISDRGLTDVYAYSTYHFLQNKLSQNELDTEFKKIKAFNENNKDVKYIYVPIEFNVIDDGFRSTDEEFRHFIDDAIHQTLEDLNVEYLTVSGTVEERINQIKLWIKKQ